MNLLKWVGGKSAHAEVIASYMPDNFEMYVELFLGSGAVFEYLRRDPNHNHVRYLLSDANAELMNVYRAVRDSDQFEKHLQRLQSQSSEDDYYRIRDEFNASKADAARGAGGASAVWRAAMFVYLNKRGFRGLYRESKNGFNVPFGHYPETQPIYDPETLRKWEQILQTTVYLRPLSFDDAIVRSDVELHQYRLRSRVIYADPPYIPISKTASFDKYVSGGFTLEDHSNLVRMLIRAVADCRGGTMSLLSASETDKIDEIFAHWRDPNVRVSRHVLPHQHRINPFEKDKGSRKITNELLFVMEFSG